MAAQHSVLQTWRTALAADLDGRRKASLYRELREIDGPQGPTLTLQGRELVQFCTNNYLGLANDPAVVDAARDALGQFGMGAGASRLVAGSMALHHRLEERLARFERCERALVFSTGFMANLAVLTTFAGPGDKIASDKLNHASLLDAARFSGAEQRTFPHRRYGRAEELLKREGPAGTGRRFLVTDSVFSMDGDLADLPAACAAAEAGGALVVIDEAHGTGVLGAGGRGLAELQGVEERVALKIGTLSKALGSVGGFVAGPAEAIETLVNAARSFIYTTALPPACSAAAMAALDIVESAEGRRRRERVLGLAEYLREQLRSMGFDCGESETPIVPVMLGSAERAVAVAGRLLERGLFVPAIRPPTVPPNSARLRISLMATHSDGQVEQLVKGMREERVTSRE